MLRDQEPIYRVLDITCVATPCKYSLLCLMNGFNWSMYLVYICPHCKRMYITARTSHREFYLSCEISKRDWVVVEKSHSSDMLLVGRGRCDVELEVLLCDECIGRDVHVKTR